MTKCIVLIDGSNFYYKLKDLQFHNLLNFDFSGFAKMLAGSNNEIIHTTYYIGKIRTDGTEKTKRLFDNQQKLLGHLKKHNFRYSLGYLMKNGRVYHEKGVDVNIAVEYIGFSHGPSVAMVARCSESYLIKKEDIESFVKIKTEDR